MTENRSNVFAKLVKKAMGLPTGESSCCGPTTAASESSCCDSTAPTSESSCCSDSTPAEKTTSGKKSGGSCCG